jgi:hypothetical protein
MTDIDTGTQIEAQDVTYVAGAPPTANDAPGSDNTFVGGLNPVGEVYGGDKSFVPVAGFAGDIHIDQLYYKHADRIGG